MNLASPKDYLLKGCAPRLMCQPRLIQCTPINVRLSRVEVLMPDRNLMGVYENLDRRDIVPNLRKALSFLERLLPREFSSSNTSSVTRFITPNVCYPGGS
jgi:hypothetical protein